MATRGQFKLKNEKFKMALGWAVLFQFSFILYHFTPNTAQAVNGDLQSPTWRGQAGTTRQHWRFDTDATLAAPEVFSNPFGTPRANIAPNAYGVGWLDTTCAWLGIGCDPWNGDPDPYGTAQGYWDLGGTNASVPSPGTILLSITNSVVAGATRYLWVQTTAWIESGIAAYPLTTVSNAVQIGAAVNLLAENPTNYDGSLASGAWYNQRTLWTIPATGTVDRVMLRSAGVGTIIDSVAVDTALLSVNTDTYTRGAGMPVKIKKTDLLVNDLGPALAFAGVTTTSTNNVTLTTDATSIYYPGGINAYDRLTYNIADGYGGAASGYILIQVVPGTSTNRVNLQVGVPGPNTNTLTLAGIPGYTYIVQFATNYPGAPWFNLSTNTAGANGLWTVVDTSATNASRYYRVSTP